MGKKAPDSGCVVNQQLKDDQKLSLQKLNTTRQQLQLTEDRVQLLMQQLAAEQKKNTALQSELDTVTATAAAAAKSAAAQLKAKEGEMQLLKDTEGPTSKSAKKAAADADAKYKRV